MHQQTYEHKMAKREEIENIRLQRKTILKIL